MSSAYINKIFKVLKDNWLLILILLVGGFLRLYRIDVLMRFIWDEGRDMLAIRNIVVNKDLTLFGPFNEIAGHKDFFGVFHYYLMLPALVLFNFDPVGPAIFTALLGVLALLCWYIWLHGWQDKKTALWTITLMATSPLVVRFNQWAWNPNTIGFFASLYLLCLQQYQRQFKLLWISFAGLFLGLLFQLHYFTLALIMPALLILFQAKKKRWQDMAFFAFLFILPNLSFVIFDLTHQGFYLKIILESFLGNSQQKFVEISLQTIFNPFVYLFDVAKKFTGSLYLGILALAAFLILLCKNLISLYKNYKKTKRVDEGWQLAASWVLFLLLTSFFPSLLDDYHSAALWILMAISLVIGVKYILNKRWAFVLSLLILYQIYSNQFWRQPDWQENMPKLRRTAQIVAQAATMEESNKLNFASFVDPETRGLRFRYFLALKNVKLMGNDDYPRSEILYIATPHSWIETRENPAWELATFKNAQPTLIGVEDDWQIYRLEK